jgi:carbamoyl-phosphate synthase large subunit
VNILFTSAGRRVELLRAFRAAYRALGLQGRIVAADLDPLAPALSAADQAYLVPPLSSPEYIPRLVAICRDERIRLVFPLIDPEIPLLARSRTAIEETGAEVVVGSEETVGIAADKWRTQEFFRGLGIIAPASWLPGNLDPATARYPLFLKPRGGSAGKNSFRIENAEQLRFFGRTVSDPIVEEFLPGPEITNDVVCNLKGDVLAVVSRKRIEVRSGEVTKAVTIYDETVLKTCVRIAEALKPKGQITVQCIMKEGTPHFTEINARFGGGAPLAIAAGCDSPLWLLAEAAALPVNVPPLGAYTRGLYTTRFDDAFFLKESDLAKDARGPVRP